MLNGEMPRFAEETPERRRIFGQTPLSENGQRTGGGKGASYDRCFSVTAILVNL